MSRGVNVIGGIGAFCTLFLCACAGSGGDGGTTLEVPLGANAQNVALTGGATQQVVYSKTLPGQTAFTGLSLDLATAIANTTLTFPVPKPGLRAAPTKGTATLNAWVAGAGEEATVCGGGIPYGPFTITWDAASASGSVDSPTVAVTQSTLSIVNTGSFTLCVEVTPTLTASASVARVGLSLNHCNDPVRDISGTWTGTYTCINTPKPDCGDEVDQPITLNVNQNGHSASYTDGTANFQGTECNGVFPFEGGGAGYTEEGTFTLLTPNTASKTSDWRDTFPGAVCSGHCTDTLTRI